MNLVSVSFTVTDAAGHYVEGLPAGDIRIFEDGVEQQINSFATPEAMRSSELPVENSVFVLVDTGNAMYEEFMQVNDLVTDFVRGIGTGHAVAVYTFSRKLFRSLPLSRNALRRRPRSAPRY